MASSTRRAPLLLAAAALLGLVWLLRLLAVAGPPDEEPDRPAPAPAAPVAVVEPSLPEPRALDGDAALVVPLEDEPPAGMPVDGGGRFTEERVVALRLVVRHADGRPATRVGAVLARGPRVLAQGRTDDEGRVRLDGVEGEADLYLGGVLPVVHRVPLASASGEHDVRVPDGGVIEGRVTVDGAPPVAPLPLTLAPVSREAAPDGGERLRAWPMSPGDATPPWPVRAALRAAVPGLGASRLENAQLTGPDGEFRFSGLPSGWGAIFTVPDALRWVRDDEERRGPAVIAPASGVLLELTRLARVTGRVLAPGGRVPVPGALVRWTMTGRASRMGQLETDPDGRFSVPLVDTTAASMTLNLRDPGWDASLELALPTLDHVSGTDLGDLELVRVRRVAFRALDPDRTPLVGAIAVADDGTGARSPRTDAEGRSELRGLAAGTRAMVVWAARHRPTEVPLPDPLPPELVVVLPRAAALDVLVTRPDGQPSRHVLVEVATEQALFERPERLLTGGVSVLPEAISFETGTSRPSGASFRSVEGDLTVAVGRMTFAPDVEGRVQLSAVRAFVPFTLSVKDASGLVVWGPETLSLDEGEWREVSAVMPFSATDLEVLVVDGARSPLAGAQVTVRSAVTEAGRTETTRADGIARFPELYSERFDVTVERDGYAMAVLPKTAPPRAGSALEVMMLPGLTVTVTLRDATGASVAADSVWATLEGRTVSTDASPSVGNDLPAGALFGSQWRLLGLPSQPVTLRARLGTRVVDLQHDPRVPYAEIVVDG